MLYEKVAATFKWYAVNCKASKPPTTEIKQPVKTEFYVDMKNLENLFSEKNVTRHKGFVVKFHKDEPGKPYLKLQINFVVKDVNIKGAYILYKIQPSQSKNLDNDSIKNGKNRHCYESRLCNMIC